MLNKNGMRPAFASANAQGFSNSDRATMNGHISFSESQPEADDFNAFGSAPQKQRTAPQRPQPTKQRPPKQKKPPVKIPVKAILAACGIIAAIILIIVISVAIFSAPKKEIRIEDNAYFAYVEPSETGDVTRVVSNGKLIKQTFSGEVEIIPATDYSFAYIVEEVTADEDSGRESGFYTYVLKGNKVKELGDCADEKPQFAMLEPGIVYKQGSSYYYQTSDNFSTLTKNEADNFIISNDAKIVVYTEIAKNTGKQTLKYFKNSASRSISSAEVVPVALSNDGKYVFATDGSKLGYFEINKNDESEVAPTGIFSANGGSFVSIVGMNTSGKEIVFQATANGELVSYLYTIGTKGTLTEIGKGVYTPINADSEIVCPSTFVDSYFIRSLTVSDILDIDEEDVDDEEDVVVEDEEETENDSFVPTVATYFFDKSEGARHIADATGQFSPDLKYFYYIDEADNLVRVPLDSKDFKKDAKTILNSVSDFKVVEKGDLYVMHTNVEKKQGKIFFVDASTSKSPSIADKVDLGSMQYCGNSIYFSITTDDTTTIYVSTNGSAKEVANFKSGTPTETPVIVVGANGMGESAYAYFLDANGAVKLYYTSNGKKFSLVAQNCTIAGFEASLPSDPTENTEESSNESETEAE